MSRKKNRNSPHQVTRHHIIPKSRIKGMGIEGVCKVERVLHELYHSLFGNMTPVEILLWLNHTYWNDMYDINIKEKGG